jgi:hypothetical protein
MARYQRQYSSPNISNGMAWIFGIAIVAYMIFKIVSCNNKIKAVYQNALIEKKLNQRQENIITDSTPAGVLQK